MKKSQKSASDPSLAITVQYATDALEARWKPILTSRKIKRWAAIALKISAVITIRIVGSAESRRLNREYRGKDYPTNILTFGYPELGDDIQADLVICMPVLVKEAKSQKKILENHLIHLLIHGLLHAQGFDHEDTVEAQAMESLEVTLLSQLGLENPYLS